MAGRSIQSLEGMQRIPEGLTAYHQSGKPLLCELQTEPWRCEFWPFHELIANNDDYEVSRNAPGYFGFATSGGGEMYAVSPSGQVVCLAFVAMSPSEALPIADTWSEFEAKLHAL